MKKVTRKQQLKEIKEALDLLELDKDQETIFDIVGAVIGRAIRTNKVALEYFSGKALEYIKKEEEQKTAKPDPKLRAWENKR